MGRANNKSDLYELADPAFDSSGADADGFIVLPPDQSSGVGSEIHRQRLEGYARARTGRSDIRLSLSHFCGSCHHEYEEHTVYADMTRCRGNGPDGSVCSCDNYRPSGGSFTDMRGNITVQSDVPPNGSDEERELAILGLLRHELAHEMYTSTEVHKVFVEEMERMMQNGEEVSAGQLKTLWNILEDGMIETRMGHHLPEAYQFIEALNRVHPRVGVETTIEEEMKVPAPEGYVAEDVYGNQLTNIIKEQDPYTGDMRDVLVIPAGTRISPWGANPISIQNQAEAALLAESVPGFRPGCGRVDCFDEETRLPLPEGNTTPVDINGNALKIDGDEVIVPAGVEITQNLRPQMPLHPTVQEALDNLDADIDAAVRGNSQDCVIRAHAVHKEFREKGLLRGDLTDEERKMLEQIADAMGGTMSSAPEGGGPGQEQGEGQGSGAPQGPANGTPSGGGGMSDDLQKALDEMNKQKGGGGSGGSEDGKEQEEGQGSGEGDEKGKEQGSGQGGDSSDGPKDQQGFGQGGAPQEGSEDDSGGFDPNKPLPESARDKKSSGMSQADLDKMIDEARRNQKQDRDAKAEDDTMRRRQNKLEADEVQSPDGSNARSQRDLADKAQQTGDRAFEDERYELQALGHELASDLQRMKVKTRARSRRLRSGKLDKRSLTRVPAGDTRVFAKRSKDEDFDMEIDVIIDRSGSVAGNPVDNDNQMRMALMLGAASVQAEIPMSIYGYDGGGGQSTTHYAYKERHSRDLAGIEALPRTGGGGTPTGDAIRRGRFRMRTSDAQQRVMLIITDGMPSFNQQEISKEQVIQANREGVRVIGLGFGVGSALSPEGMDDIFGEGGWMAIEDYKEAPRLLADMVRDAAANSMS